MNQFNFDAGLNRFAGLGYDIRTGGVRLREMSATAGLSPVQQGRADMDVRGVGSVSGTTPIRPQQGTPASLKTPVSRPQAPQDQLELSSAGKMLDQLSQTPDMRAERLAQIKEAIANGTYDTDEKLEAALSRMFDAIGDEPDLG